MSYIFIRVITFFRKCEVIQCGLGEVLTAHKKIFEQFSYLKKVLETMSNFWPIGSGRLKLGRLAGLLQGFMNFFQI